MHACGGVSTMTVTEPLSGRPSRIAVRSSSAEAIRELKALGLTPVLLTGDNEAAARRIAAEVGIDGVIATAVGAGAWIFGYPFLSAHAQYIDVPVIGKVPFSTAMLFDLGVFSVVVGAIVLMLIAIAHQSLRVAPRPRRADTAGEAD